MDAEYDPAFTFAHDYSAHCYDCPIAEGGMANILECTCGYERAYAESEAYLNGLRAAEARAEAAEQALLAMWQRFVLERPVENAVDLAQAALAAARPEQESE